MVRGAGWVPDPFSVVKHKLKNDLGPNKTLKTELRVGFQKQDIQVIQNRLGKIGKFF